jgi:hypothetical protein
MNDLIKIILIVLFAVLLIILGPLAVIWSVNTLFPAVDIKYTFDTWCAILLLGAFLRANVTVKK